MPQNHLEMSSSFKPVSRATKVMKTSHKATRNHENESWHLENQLLRKMIFAIPLMANSWFPIPNIQIETQNYQKTKSGNKHKQIHLFCPRYPKSFQNGVPPSTNNQLKFKPGPQSVLSCAPQCPRIVPVPPGPRSGGTMHAKLQVWAPNV